MKKFFRKEVIIGLVVILSLAVLFVGIDYLKGINVFKPANFYIARYSNVEGLSLSAPVTINGFQVGIVREISYDYANNGQMLVEMSLDKELKIPVGTQALLASDLLGTSTIKLELGNSKDYYAIGDNIPSGIQKGIMDDVNSKLLPAVTNIMPKIDSLMSNMNAIVSNPALTASINRLDNITANLETSTRDLNILMGRSIPKIATDVNGITKNLNTVTCDLTKISAELKNLPIDSTMANIQATTENLRQLTQSLNGNQSTLGLLVHDRGLYDHLDNTVKSLDSLLIDLKKHPKKYVNFKLF